MTNAKIYITFYDITEDKFASENDIRRYIRNSFKDSKVDVSIHSIDFLDEAERQVIYPVFSDKEPHMVD